MSQTQVGHRMPRVESLTGLRWFAALFVFIHHIANLAAIRSLTSWSWLGVSGVAFFFVLSGFVLTWSWFPRDTARRFYWRRFARIYPLHLATTLLALPVFYGATLFQKPFNIWAVTLSIVLLHGWFTSTAIFFAGNPASWSLSDEVFFYAVFPGIARRLMGINVRAALVLAAGCIAMMWVVAVAVVAAHPSSGATTFAMTSPLNRVFEFGLGICVAIAMRKGWHPPLSFWASVGLFVAMVFVMAFWFRHPPAQPGLRAAALMNQVTAPFYALLIATAASRDVRGQPSVLRHRSLIALGHWSYGFYLTHATVLYAVILWHGGRFVGGFGLKAGVIVGTLGASIVLAALLYRLVEHPIERKLRNMLPPLEE